MAGRGRAAAARRRSGRGRPSPLRAQAALERLAEVVDQLAGLPIPASVLERDVLPARVPGYQPRLLDELGAMGEVAWVGRGSLGRDDGRLALYRPGREVVRAAGPGAPGSTGAPDGPTEPPSGPRHVAIRTFLARRGASFYREIHAAAGGGPDREMLDALWDLVWAGEVTNDTFAPLRALRWARPGREARRRPGRLTSLGPPEAAGRWSLWSARCGRCGRRSRFGPAGSPRPRPASTPSPPVLLERHGVLTREAVVAEGVVGGFSAVYPVLRALEEAGRIRRGYFVDGLGAAQFALPGAIDRLRTVREPAEPADRGRVHLLAAADPANPYGAALAWPRRDDADRRPLARAAGAYVVLVDGRRGALPRAWRAIDRDASRPPTTRRSPSSRCARLGALIVDGRIARARRDPGRRGAGRRVGAGSRPSSRPASCRATAASVAAGPAEPTMPEGDTLRRTADGLRPHLVGRS